jgi:hypothetical protein
MPPHPKLYPKMKTFGSDSTHFQKFDTPNPPSYSSSSIPSSTLSSIAPSIKIKVKDPLTNPTIKVSPQSAITKKRKRTVSSASYISSDISNEGVQVVGPPTGLVGMVVRPKSPRSTAQISNIIELQGDKHCTNCQKFKIEICKFDKKGYLLLRQWMHNAPKGTQSPRGVHAAHSSCYFCTKGHRSDCLPWDADLYLGENFKFSHSYRGKRPMYKSNFLTNFFGCDRSGNLLPDFNLDLASILQSAIDPPQKAKNPARLQSVKKHQIWQFCQFMNHDLHSAKSTKSNPSLPSTNPIKLLTMMYEKQHKQEESIQRLAEMLNGIQRTLETRNLASNQQPALPEFVEGSSNRPLEQSANYPIEVDDEDRVEGDEDAEEDMVDGLWGEDLEHEEVI